jgi:site-specific DNA recombinase
MLLNLILEQRRRGKMSDKVAGYGRVSTLGQVDGTSPEEQKRIITEECSRKGWELIHFYSDEGYSGKNAKRPGFVQLLTDAKKGHFQIVVFTKLDRFGRSMRDILNNLNELSDLGVKIYCVNQPEINSEGVYGKLLMQLLAAFSEFEHSMISERTKQGRKAAWKGKGSIMGSSPYGYKIDRENGKKIVIDKEKKEIYDRIVSMYLDQRMFTNEIALQLTNEKIPPPFNRGSKRWYYSAILRILRNPAYLGEQFYNVHKLSCKTNAKGKEYYVREKEMNPKDDWVTIKYPPFITKEKFDAIQARIKQNTRFPLRKFKEYDDHFLLEKGLLYCGECGGKMNKMLVKNGKYKQLKYVCYWKYHNVHTEIAGRKKCGMVIDADRSDNQVLYEVFNFLSDPLQFAQAWFKELDMEKLQATITRLTEEKDAEDKALKRLYDRYAMDDNNILDLTIKQHETRRNEINVELNRVRSEYDFATNKVNRFQQFQDAYKKSDLRKKMNLYYSTQKEFMDFLDSLSFEQKQKIVEAVISPENGGKITVSENVEGGVEIEIDFQADLNRIENLITSFDGKKGLLRYNINRN